MVKRQHFSLSKFRFKKRKNRISKHFSKSAGVRNKLVFPFLDESKSGNEKCAANWDYFDLSTFLFLRLLQVWDFFNFETFSILRLFQFWGFFKFWHFFLNLFFFSILKFSNFLCFVLKIIFSSRLKNVSQINTELLLKLDKCSCFFQFSSMISAAFLRSSQNSRFIQKQNTSSKNQLATLKCRARNAKYLEFQCNEKWFDWSGQLIDHFPRKG